MSRIVSLISGTVLSACEALNLDELIVVPTDTVYGVAARIDEAAIDRLYQAKGRPDEKPIPVLLSDVDRLSLVCEHVPAAALTLAEAFWPGPLTIVLPKAAGLPANLTTLPTVGVRVPDHDLTRAIIREAGGALAVTSANQSGAPNSMSIQEAFLQLGDTVAYYMDDGPAPGGVPSSVVTFDEAGELQILREGPLTAAVLREVLG